MTLEGAQNLIPAVLRSRYSDDFLVAVGNEVLGDIEQECDPDYFRAETPLILLEGATDYALPDSVRHVRGVYEICAGDVTPDRNHPVAIEVLGNTLRLGEPWSLSETEDISGTVAAGAPAAYNLLFDDTAGKLDGTDLEDDELKSRLVTITHAAPASVVEYRIALGNSVDDTTVTLNGNLLALAIAGNTYRITSNFLIIEHTRYLTRFTAKAGVLPVSQEFEKLMRIGLTYKFHFQADEMSREAKEWQTKYQDELDRFRIDTTKPRGMVPRNVPRSLPSLGF